MRSWPWSATDPPPPGRPPAGASARSGGRVPAPEGQAALSPEGPVGLARPLYPGKRKRQQVVYHYQPAGRGRTGFLAKHFHRPPFPVIGWWLREAQGLPERLRSVTGSRGV